MKIHAPNKSYTGISAGVTFVNGVGETEDPRIIEWFKKSGYVVEEQNEEPSEDFFESMTVEELKAYAEEKGIDIGKATSKDGIIKKIQKVEEADDQEEVE